MWKILTDVSPKILNGIFRKRNTAYKKSYIGFLARTVKADRRSQVQYYNFLKMLNMDIIRKVQKDF